MKRLVAVALVCAGCYAAEQKQRQFTDGPLAVTVKETDLSAQRNVYPWVSGCFTEVIVTTAEGSPIPDSFTITLMHRDSAGKLRSQSDTAQNGAAIPSRVRQDARTMFWTDRCSFASLTVRPNSAAVVFVIN